MDEIPHSMEKKIGDDLQSVADKKGYTLKCNQWKKILEF